MGETLNLYDRIAAMNEGDERIGLVKENRAARIGKIGASEYANAAGGERSRAAVIFRLMCEHLTGKSYQKSFFGFAAAAMENESRAVAAYKGHREFVANKQFLTIPNESWGGGDSPIGLGATPDGITPDGRPIEVKASAKGFENATEGGTTDVKHLRQLGFQVYVLRCMGFECSEGFLLYANPDNPLDVCEKEIAFSPNDIKIISRKLIQITDEFELLRRFFAEGRGGVTAAAREIWAMAKPPSGARDLERALAKGAKA